MNVLSLFSGVGGFDIGLERSGMSTMFQCEVDANAMGVLNKHWASVPKWGDISTLTASEVLKHGNPDVVAWGSPCQDLSVAGRRAGLGGGKSSLFHEGMRIIRELREETNNVYPRVSIWENVPGALTSNRGADFGKVLDEMAEAGAVVIEWAVLDAKNFGIPQRRRRIFVVAIFDPALAERCPNPLLPVAKSVQRNIGTTEIAAFYSTHGKHDAFQVGVTPPLKSVSTMCIIGKSSKPRKLTPIEHERLMGWDDDHTKWTVDGKQQADTHRYKQCGNGVASPVAEWVGSQIMKIEKEMQNV